ncbi:hypothetical protein Droror1_Dr00005479 [Drosera rotundifolia]
MRMKVSYYIMINELPFTHVDSFMFNEVMRTATPHWQRISRKDVREDCFRTFDIEKKLKPVLKEVERVNITTDMWTSQNQKLGYMVITGHWIDKKAWKLNMRVLNFYNIPPPYWL